MIHRILIIRVCAIGDFILNLPALIALEKMYPNTVFTLVGNPSSLELAREFVPVENIHSIELQPWCRLFHEPLRELNFSSAYVWMRDSTVAVNLEHSGIPDVTRADPFPTYGHAADHLLRTVSLERPRLPDLWVKDSDDVIIHPSSGGPGKIWPHFDALAPLLSDAVILRENSPPQLWRGKPERSDGWGGAGQETRSFDQHHPGASRHPSSAEEGSLRIPILENLSLTEVAQHLRHCRAYIGNDSGITHLAAFLGCPTVALFGPTDPRIWGPIGRRSRVIWKRRLEDITVDEVLLAVRR